MIPFDPEDIVQATLDLARTRVSSSRIRLAVSKVEWERMLAHMAKFEMFLADRNKLAVERLEVNGIELVIDERF